QPSRYRSLAKSCRKRICLAHGVDPVAVDGDVATELQRLCLAARLELLVADGLEVGIVRKAEYAAMNLDTRKAEQVDPDLVQKLIERLFGAERIALVFK